MKVLYEILVPTRYGDDHNKPISTRHHKQWDKYIQSITGGLTIMKPARGKWVSKGVEYPERIIPVRVMCEENDLPMDFEKAMDFCELRDTAQIDTIIDFTIKHYRQKAVMYYIVSNDIKVRYA